MRKLLAVSVLAAVMAIPLIFGPASGAASKGVVASATGSGQMTYLNKLRTFSFTARKYGNGAAKGQLEVYNRGQAKRQHGRVECLAVVGNTAYVSGHITASTSPADVGAPFVFGVQDNGRGKKTPDKISLVFYAPGSQVPYDCTNAATQTLATPIYPIAHGNITVH